MSADRQGRPRSELPARTQRGRSSRANGTNPRARGTNPRATGQHKATTAREWLDTEVRRHASRIRQAMARLHSRGEHWCDDCDDTGYVTVTREQIARPVVGAQTYIAVEPCGHAPMTVSDADLILNPRYYND